MHPTPSKCPVCSETLTVTRLHCPRVIPASRAASSTAAWSGFLPTSTRSWRCSCGWMVSFNWVAQELKVSYPTVRSRLDDVIRAMGREVHQAAPSRGKGACGGTAPGDPGRPGRGQDQPG